MQWMWYPKLTMVFSYGRLSEQLLMLLCSPPPQRSLVTTNTPPRPLVKQYPPQQTRSLSKLRSRRWGMLAVLLPRWCISDGISNPPRLSWYLPLWKSKVESTLPELKHPKHMLPQYWQQTSGGFQSQSVATHIEHRFFKPCFGERCARQDPPVKAGLQETLRS
jgi:hypothetical protein